MGLNSLIMTDVPNTSEPTQRSPSAISVEGKKVLITGASRGIGRALAEGFAREGAEVICVARSSESLLSLKKGLKDQGAKVRIHAADLTVTDFSKMIQEIGTVDALIHSAGLARHSPIQEINQKDFESVMAVNVWAPLMLSKQIIQDWRRQKKGGSIIFVSSQLAHVGMANRCVYSASKSAIEGLSRSLAIELAKDGIRVNTICPTFTSTEMTAKALEDPRFREEVIAKIPLGRLGFPGDYLGICLLLASDPSGTLSNS